MITLCGKLMRISYNSFLRFFDKSLESFTPNATKSSCDIEAKEQTTNGPITEPLPASSTPIFIISLTSRGHPSPASLEQRFLP